ncbi:hypothetical protein NBRC116494_16800 [Aurantivibrio plasticivorans]
MKVFNKDATAFSAQYSKERYVNIVGGVTPEFLDFAQTFATQKQNNREGMEEWEFKGKKQQYLFEFADGGSCPTEVLDFVADVAGYPRGSITLCERHIKIYEDVANTNPPPHKDRVASQITVGIPLKVPANSYIILYPNDELTINPFSSTALWRSSLDEDQLPENVLKGLEPVSLDVQPGDVVFFEGNSIYHERVNPAFTSLLYLKFNAIDLDPIGEDDRTITQFDRSQSLLKTSSDEELLSLGLSVSPRLENVRRLYTRLNWNEVIQANMVGEKEFTLTEFEFSLITKLAKGDSVAQLFDRLGVPKKHQLSTVGTLRRLIKLKAIDLLD